MKLKFTAAPNAAPPVSEPATPVSATPKLSLKFGKKSQESQDAKTSTPATGGSATADPAKVKRKYTKKVKDENGESVDAASKQKRKAKELGSSEADGSVSKKLKDDSKSAGKLKIRVPSMSGTGTMGAPAVPRIHIPARVSLSARTASTPILKVKAKGHIPVRPLGVGYDSEGEDIEPDPAIESQFVLRMQPGDDCDYLRKAIADKKIGLPAREDGADIAMKFFDKDGRRGMISIRGRHYSAFLLDLPCIIEGMKSWDRRGWYKSADICQILVVDKQMKDEAEIKAASIPREIDQMHHQYPHGLTPPMHFVRKRRFRKRMNYRTIEHVEDEVERLLKEDEAAIAGGGKSEYRLIDPDHQSDEEDAQGEDEEEGQYGDIVPGYDFEGQNEEEEDDVDDIAAMMEREFAQGAEEDMEMAAAEDGAISPGIMHASPDTLSAPVLPLDPVASPAATDGTGTGNDGEDDDLFSGDDDEEEGDGDNEVDEDELARQQEIAQQREEIEDLRKEVADAEANYQKQTNVLLRQRAMAKVKSLKEDLRVKLASIGEEDE